MTIGKMCRRYIYNNNCLNPTMIFTHVANIGTGVKSPLGATLKMTPKG